MSETFSTNASNEDSLMNMKRLFHTFEEESIVLIYISCTVLQHQLIITG